MNRGIQIRKSSTISGAVLYDGKGVQRFSTDWHLNEGWQVIAVTEGTRRYQFRGGLATVEPGQLVILPPRVLHRAQCGLSETTSFRIATLLTLPGVTAANCSALSRARTHVVLSGGTLLKTFLTDGEPLTALQGQLRTVLTANQMEPENQPLSATLVAVRQVETYILTHLEEAMSLHTLAALVRWSTFHLEHMFTKHVGLSPIVFHTRARLGKAKTLMANGYSLSDISTALRFADQSHFGRHFRRVYDMTPGDFRRSMAIS